MKFPKRLRHRGKGKVLATIYKRPAGYRLYWRARVDGKRRSLMKDFPTYSAAKREADKVLSDLVKGSPVTALSTGQATHALAALERLQTFFQNTGRHVSLLAGINEYCEAAEKLTGHTLAEAVERFINTVAIIQRKPLNEAVVEFLENRKHLSKSKDGKRSRHSPVYEANVASWLNAFAISHPGNAVCDLSKDHLNFYIGAFKELSAKSRNDRRAAIKMFLRWCAAKDYLSQSHRLFEAVDFKTEDSEATEIDFYRPGELRTMLSRADADLLPVLALGGLAGLRREEIFRLEWADVWRVKGKIEISARIAKGRKRRLVDICPALAAWLTPYRLKTGLVWSGSAREFEGKYATLRHDLSIPARRNGLRHAFVTYHFATQCNENLTASEAGNSPQMIHAHYRGLATKADAAKWFAVKPARKASAGKIIQLATASNC